jgi:hypothetical protein
MSAERARGQLLNGAYGRPVPRPSGEPERRVVGGPTVSRFEQAATTFKCRNGEVIERE